MKLNLQRKFMLTGMSSICACGSPALFTQDQLAYASNMFKNPVVSQCYGNSNVTVTN